MRPDFFIFKGTSDFCSELVLDDMCTDYMKATPEGFYDIVATDDTVEGGIPVMKVESVIAMWEKQKTCKHDSVREYSIDQGERFRDKYKLCTDCNARIELVFMYKNDWLQERIAELEATLKRVTEMHFEESVALGVANNGWRFEEHKNEELLKKFEEMKIEMNKCADDYGRGCVAPRHKEFVAEVTKWQKKKGYK